jgi:hypothetical protein
MTGYLSAVRQASGQGTDALKETDFAFWDITCSLGTSWDLSSDAADPVLMNAIGMRVAPGSVRGEDVAS